MPERAACIVLLSLLSAASPVDAQVPANVPTFAGQPRGYPTAPPDLTRVSDQQWDKIDQSVDSALKWLASQQRPDGSFPTKQSGQPGITSLCIMAFVSAGHFPSEGPYGKTLDHAIEYVLRQQQPDGVFSSIPPAPSVRVQGDASHAATYNHGITGLMLGEVYGVSGKWRSDKMAEQINKALGYTRRLQVNSRKHGVYRGGWRYLTPFAGNEWSDLSATSWQVMFYRSAANAGFEVPKEYVQESTAFIHRCYDQQNQQFIYAPQGEHQFATCGVVGGAVVCLVLSGQSNKQMERASSAWLLRNFNRPYNSGINWKDRYHYGAFYMSQAAFQLGGETWARVYPQLADTLVRRQNPGGSWAPEQRDAMFGNAYSTALGVLTLTPPHQLLPIYQR